MMLLQRRHPSDPGVESPHAGARRGGFTLLEVLLASALAIVLMAALYVALDVQLRLASEGRDAIEQATLTRAILHRFENDLNCSLGPVAPPPDTSGGGGRSGGGGGGGSGGGGGAAGGGGAGASGAGASGAGGMTPEEGSAVTEMVTVPDTITFQAGVIGESDRLIIYAARVASLARTDESGEVPTPSDTRRIMYWLTGNGLARQEVPWVTSEQVTNTTDPVAEDGKEEKDYVIAEEVTQLQFEYWDGSAWQESWDGRQPGPDGITMKGPPMAIRVRFWLRVPGTEPGETVEKEFRHTIAVRAAAGPAVPETTTPTGQ
jgi:hypothetical protein